MQVADFSHLPVRCRFIAMMPQWDFLDFLAAQGKRYPAFTVLMRAEATGLIEEGSRVVGVRATREGRRRSAPIWWSAPMAATRRCAQGAGFRPTVLGAPMDVLWFRLTHKPTDKAETMGRFDRGSILVMLDRGDYWQCAYRHCQGIGRGAEGGRHREVPRRRSLGSCRSSPTGSTSSPLWTTSSC